MLLPVPDPPSVLTEFLRSAVDFVVSLGFMPHGNSERPVLMGQCHGEVAVRHKSASKLFMPRQTSCCSSRGYCILF